MSRFEVVYGDTLPEAYHRALVALYSSHSSVPCPDYNTNQIECQLTMCVENPLKEPMISKLGIFDPRSLEQYRLEILDGILDFEIDKGKWSYTYHSRIVPQIDFIVDELKRNPYSRRAVIDIRDNTHDAGNENPACLQHIQYFIRDSKLVCNVLFRSNDACKATFMNAFALIMLQKKLADILGVEVGEYTHTANSFHCYERDYALLENYVNYLMKHGLYNNNTYNYVGDWDEMMADERDYILKKVEELQRR